MRHHSIRLVARCGLVASLALFSLACVTRGSFDEMVAERDTLAAERDELVQANTALSMQTRGLSVTTAALIGKLALQEAEMAQLEQEQREFEDEVARWAVAGAIKMELLTDGLHLVLPHDVLFESGSAKLTAEGDKLVAELVEEIGEQPYQIAVLGFTDNVPIGPALADQFPSNWELAGARAASVVRVMQREGIPAAQLAAVSRGESEPLASNDTPEGRAENRRIDIRMRPVVRE